MLPGQLAKKPLSVWAVQGILALGIAFMFLVLFLHRDEVVQELGATAIIWLIISVQMGLVVGIQLRKQWARWITAVLIALASFGSFFMLLAPGNGTRFAATLIVGGSFLLLGARFMFGAPARRYFRLEPLSPE